MSLELGVKNVRVKKPKAEEILAQALEMLRQEIPDIQGDDKDGVVEMNIDQALQDLPVPDTYDTWEQKSLARYEPFSSYPFVLRDIALWVPEVVTENKILELIKKEASDLLVRADLFDTFKKDGRVSYAFHLVFQSKEKTLTDGEVGDIMNRIVASMQKEDWEVR